jgi:hypothetical protein
MGTWVPSRKWFALLVTTIGALATAGLTQGWDSTAFELALVAATTNLATTYLVPNGDGGGAPGPREKTA